MAVNSEPKILLANSLFLQEKYADAFEQYSKIFEEDPTNLLALLKRATCQANLGNWEAALTDAITAREMDPRSVEAWKLCARGLAGGDVNAALDCLLEALHIDCNDQEACTILQSIVEDHLNKTIEVHLFELSMFFYCKQLPTSICRGFIEKISGAFRGRRKSLKYKL